MSHFLKIRVTRGFSLIEMMVVITIMAIMLSAAAPSFQVWIANSKIRTAADGLLNGLQVARSEAIRRNRSVQLRLTANSDGVLNGGWQVISAPSGAICPLEAPLAEDILQIRSAQEGTTGITATATPLGATRVTFSPVGLLNSSCNTPITTLTVDNPTIDTNDSSELRIVVSPTGGTRMCEPNRPSTDPRAC